MREYLFRLRVERNTFFVLDAKWLTPEAVKYREALACLTSLLSIKLTPEQNWNRVEQAIAFGDDRGLLSCGNIQKWLWELQELAVKDYHNK